MEPNYWKASWIWSGNTSEPEAHRYFVTHFEADPDQLSKVVFQGASDDRGTVYLNGKAAVKINGWAIPAVNENLKSLLVKGKNTLAVDAFNVGGGSGFLGELNLVGKDGNVTSIASGTDWKASERLTPGWNQPGFDVSGWTSATARLRPPQVPYGETAYRNFTSVPVLSRETPFLNWLRMQGKPSKFRQSSTERHHRMLKHTCCSCAITGNCSALRSGPPSTAVNCKSPGKSSFPRLRCRKNIS
ncbi:MAG: hypothetical protein V8T87_08865 [Victivallales bacterium]